MITEFIEANLARIERTAREAGARGHWDPVGDHTIGDNHGPIAEAMGAYRSHILAHDPAHVLAWVAGIRAVVEMHRPNICPNPEHPHDATCDECLDEWPCPTSRALAAIFADQPGYDEEWR